MKITRNRLSQIIKEEVERAIAQESVASIAARTALKFGDDIARGAGTLGDDAARFVGLGGNQAAAATKSGVFGAVSSVLRSAGISPKGIQSISKVLDPSSKMSPVIKTVLTRDRHALLRVVKSQKDFSAAGALARQSGGRMPASVQAGTAGGGSPWANASVADWNKHKTMTQTMNALGDAPTATPAMKHLFGINGELWDPKKMEAFLKLL